MSRVELVLFVFICFKQNLETLCPTEISNSIFPTFFVHVFLKEVDADAADWAEPRMLRRNIRFLSYYANVFSNKFTLQKHPHKLPVNVV